MPNLPKIIGTILVFSIISTVSLAENTMDIETGDVDSVSWKFVEELSRLWKFKFAGEETAFSPKYSANIEERFQSLKDRSAKFVIAPTNALSSKKLKGYSAVVAALLWRVELITIVDQEFDGSVGADNLNFWYVPDNAVLVNRAFPEGLESPNQEYIRLKNHEIPEIIPYINDGVLFYQITGGYRSFLKLFEGELKVAGVDRNLRNVLKKSTPWAETITLEGEKSKKIPTVGYTISLFTHSAEDPEFIEKVLKTISKRPVKILPEKYLLKTLILADTAKIKGSKLHKTSRQFFNNL